MSKIVIIADTHFGCRGDADVFMDNQRKALRDFFIPLLKNEGVKFVVHLGDLVDRRKGISFKTAQFVRQEFLEPVSKICGMDIICGNHDVAYKNTNETNALHEMVEGRYDNISVFTEPCNRVITDGKKVLMIAKYVPWICDQNYKETMEFLSSGAPLKTKVFGHLELAGFAMYKGQPVAQHGLDASLFQRFGDVYSGHYHSPSQQGKIRYLGAAWEMTWSDAGDDRGVHILDTETLELTFYENPFTMFATINYDPKSSGLKNGVSYYVKGKIVRVIVKDRDARFDSFLKTLEDDGAVEVQVVEQPVTAVASDETTVDVENGDVLSVLKKSVQELEGVDSDALMGLLAEIHTEATQGV